MNETIVVDKHEGVFDRYYVEDLESECERQKKVVEIMSKRIHDYEVECEKLKEELAHYKYLYKVVSLHEES